MKHLLILCALSIALLGSNCDKSQRPVADQSSRTASVTADQRGNASPMPEPSGAMIFGLALLVAGVIYGAREAGGR